MATPVRSVDLKSVDWAAVMIRTAQVVGAKTNLPLVNAMAKYFPVVFEKFSIDTPEECAAFVSQAAVESAWFRTTTEYASGAAYEGRRDLGNTVKGDGVRYKGRGVFQTTGRGNYTRLTSKMKALGFPVDFVKEPQKVAEPEFAVWSAGIFWADNKLDRFASNPRQMSRAINRGNAYSTKTANHEAERVSMFNACMKMMQAPPLLKKALGLMDVVSASVVPSGSYGGTVYAMSPAQAAAAVNETESMVLVDAGDARSVPPPAASAQDTDSAPTVSSEDTSLADITQVLYDNHGDAAPPVPQPQAQPVTETPPAPVLVIPPKPEDEANVVVARYGERDKTLLAAVQRQLRRRKWACGDMDGTFGDFTRDALLSYEATHGLPLRTDVLDTFTMNHVLGSEEERPLTDKRKNATAKTPGLKDSKTVTYGQTVKKWAVGALSIVGINIASDATPTEWASGLYQNSGVLGDAVKMAKQVSNAVFTSKLTVGFLLACLAVSAATFVYFRVMDHRSGSNLGR